MDDDTITPRQLGEELGVGPKRIRDFLREKNGGPLTPRRRWPLNHREAEAVRARFSHRA